MPRGKTTVVDDAGLEFPDEFLEAAPSEETVPDPETPPTPAATSSTYGAREPRTIRANHTADVSSLGNIKAYRFKDVLDMAYSNGFVGFTNSNAQVYPNCGPAGNEPLAVVEVTAVFLNTAGEETFHAGVGDASPSNCNASVGKHFVRMAETRAKGRALAHAMNLDAVTAEELAGDEDSPNGSTGQTRAPYASRPAASSNNSNGGSFKKEISESDFPAPNSDNASGYECNECGKMMPGKTAYWSNKKYNDYLCYDCQQARK